MTYYSSHHMTQYGWITGSTTDSTEFSATILTIIDISIQYKEKIH